MGFSCFCFRFFFRLNLIPGPLKGSRNNFVYIKNWRKLCLSVFVGPCCLRAETVAVYSMKSVRSVKEFFLLLSWYTCSAHQFHMVAKGKRNGECCVASFLFFHACREAVLCLVMWAGQCPAQTSTILPPRVFVPPAPCVCASPLGRVQG